MEEWPELGDFIAGVEPREDNIDYEVKLKHEKGAKRLRLPLGLKEKYLWEELFSAVSSV